MPGPVWGPPGGRGGPGPQSHAASDPRATSLPPAPEQGEGDQAGNQEEHEAYGRVWVPPAVHLNSAAQGGPWTHFLDGRPLPKDMVSTRQRPD